MISDVDSTRQTVEKNLLPRLDTPDTIIVFVVVVVVVTLLVHAHINTLFSGNFTLQHSHLPSHEEPNFGSFLTVLHL